jgi:predicted Zn-dependent peptidase
MEEKRERYDNTPYGTLSERMMRLAYHDFPYKWTVIGDMKSIEAATVEDVHAFFNSFYVPENAVLSISGSFIEDEARSLVEKYFSEIGRAKNGLAKPVFNEKEQDQERKEIVTNEPVPLPAIFWAYRMPPDGTREAFAFDLLTDILSTGQSSRLYRSLVYEKKCASEVSAYVDLREMPGLVWFYAVGNEPNEQVTVMEEALEEILSSVRDNGVNEEEIAKAKNKAEMRAVAGRVRIATKADILAHSYMFYHDTNKVNTLLELQQSITAEDIIRVAREYLRPEKRCSVTYLPPK